MTWANARGGRGRAEGTTSWSAVGIPLRPGLNELIVTARGVTGATATASLLVTCDTAATPIRIGGVGAPFAAPHSSGSTARPRKRRAPGCLVGEVVEERGPQVALADDGMMTTISLPAFSARRATWIAAQMPLRRRCRRAALLAGAKPAG